MITVVKTITRVSLVLLLSACTAAARTTSESDQGGHVTGTRLSETERRAVICANPSDFYDNRGWCLGEEGETATAR